MERADLSIVIPFLNEEKSLPLLRERLAFIENAVRAEFVFVSDGSTDGSVRIVEEWGERNANVKLIVLSRNFGHQAALSAGLVHATGDFVGIIDADLQDPPEQLMEMYRKAREESFDVVFAIRAKRKESFLKRIGYHIFYRIYERIAETPVQLDSGDFCVLSRRAVTHLLKLPEKNRFIRGLRAWLGLRTSSIVVERPERAAGAPQYSWSRLFQLALNGLTSFSTRPLRLASIMGIVICFTAAILTVYYLVKAAVTNVHSEVPGFTTIVLLLLSLNGILLLMVGVLGEYIAQIFIEVKNRPTYIIDRTKNISQ